MQDRVREASRLASEAMALVESVGDPTLTVGLSFAAIYAKLETGEMADVLRWSQTVIDLADGDPSKGNFIFGSPLAVALASRGYRPVLAWVVPDGATTCEHAPGHGPQRRPCRYAVVVTYAYGRDTLRRADGRRSPRCARSRMPLQIAERSGDDLALAFARWTLGIALVHRANRRRSVTAD